MHIADSVHNIVNTFNECMYREIGDQDGYYDRAIWVFIDKYYAFEEDGYPESDTTDWIELGKTALIQTRTKINSDNHPLGALKTKHKINLNHNLGQALAELKKLRYPGWVPLLERLSP